MTTTSSGRVVKVQREKLVACLTCPICNDLFREATTISECLHTFCKQCIYEKIIDEESNKCPVCKTDLGVAPMEKLRADNSYEAIKAKLFPSGSKKAKARAADINSVRDATGFEEAVPFPSESRKGKAPEVGVPSISSSGRRKKKHLSSSVTRTPVATTSTSTSGKRYFTRKSSARQEKPASVQEKPVYKYGNYQERLEMAMKLRGDAPYTNQNATEKLSKLREEHNSNNIAQPKRPMLPNLNDEPEDHNSTDELENHGEATPEPSTSVPIVKGQRGRNRKPRFETKDANVPAQYVVPEPIINACDVVRCKPIWFSLEAYTWKGYAPLPQIPSSYLRVKDGNVPSSFIKKYLVKKLNLQSEEEVEILMWGQPVHPALQLNDLANIWSEKMPADEELDATVGSSAEDYVMAITYCRKTPQSW